MAVGALSLSIIATAGCAPVETPAQSTTTTHVVKTSARGHRGWLPQAVEPTGGSGDQTAGAVDPPVAPPPTGTHPLSSRPEMGGTTTTARHRHTVPPSTSSAPRVTVPPSVPEAGRSTGDIWHRLRMCESGGNYGANTGNGYYGAYQFSRATWLSVGRSGMPHLASPAEQDAAARDLQARSGWGQWPACSRKLGLR